MNLTCIVRHSPEPPPAIYWTHNEEVSDSGWTRAPGAPPLSERNLRYERVSPVGLNAVGLSAPPIQLLAGYITA